MKTKNGYKIRFDEYFPLSSFSSEQRFIIDIFVKMELRRLVYVKLNKKI